MHPQRPHGSGQLGFHRLGCLTTAEMGEVQEANLYLLAEAGTGPCYPHTLSSLSYHLYVLQYFNLGHEIMN